MKVLLPLVFLLVPLTATADAAATRTTVSDLRTLLFMAIDSPSGEAHGVLVGETVEGVNRALKTSSPILVEVTTLRRYAQPGCSRLNVTFSQKGVTLPKKTTPQDGTASLGINFCRDGKPPKSLT